MILDAVIYTIAAIAIILGFRSGYLRSMATILGYVIATPFALATAPALSLFLAQRVQMPPAYTGAVFFGIFVFSGVAFGELLRRAVGDLVGTQISIPDRLAGAALGAIRVGLLAVLMIVIFDRIIPAGREPGFLKGSKLSPYLLAAGKKGLRALPPDVAASIDRLKRERGI
jgi:membrane protein required for colicin V production